MCGLRSLLRHRGGTSRHYHERIPRTKSRKESTERKIVPMFHTRSRWTWWFYTKRDHHQGNPWSWANFASLAQLYAMPDGQHQTALGQCRYVDHKKNIFGTSTSTSTTVSCSRKVLLLAYVGLVLCSPTPALGVRNAINSAAKCSLTGEPTAHNMWAVDPPIKLRARSRTGHI